MEEILAQFAISGGMSGVVYFFIWKMLNNKIDKIESSLDKHIDKHDEYEKNLLKEMKDVYARLNSISDSVKMTEGYMRAISEKNSWGKNDKGL